MMFLSGQSLDIMGILVQKPPHIKSPLSFGHPPYQGGHGEAEGGLTLSNKGLRPQTPLFKRQGSSIKRSGATDNTEPDFATIAHIEIRVAAGTGGRPAVAFGAAPTAAAEHTVASFSSFRPLWVTFW